jgi:hypothetical protein
MLDFYFSLPLWQSAALVLVAAMVICVGSHRLVQWLFRRMPNMKETKLADAVMGVVASFIGIMLAFSAVQVWEDYGTADKAVAQEAAAISELYRDMAVYGDDTLASRAAVKTYVHAVLEDEWPRLAHGEPGPKAAAGLIQLYRDVATVQPKSSRDTVIYGEIFKKLNEVTQYRRARMIAARAALPALFWIVVVIGSCILVGYTFVHPPNLLNSLIIAGLGLSLGLIFMFILDVDHPFAGAYSVDHREISDLLPLFERISASP